MKQPDTTVRQDNRATRGNNGETREGKKGRCGLAMSRSLVGATPCWSIAGFNPRDLSRAFRGVMSFNDLYKTWRNRARRYSRRSILHTALDTLQLPAADTLQRAMRAPWITFLMIKWVFQDDYFDRIGGPKIDGTQFDDLRDKLWNLGDGSIEGIRDTLPGTLFARQLLNPQVHFARPLAAGFVRDAAILDSLGNQHPLAAMFEERTGLNVQQFMDLSIAAYGPLTKGQLNFDTSWFSPLRAIYSSEVIDSFIATVSRDESELARFLRLLPGHDKKEKLVSELFEFTPLRRYPFFREGRTLRCWDPQVFARGMEGIVHSVLSEHGNAYMDSFSKIFEKHVIAEAQRIPADFYGETDLRGILGSDSRVPDGMLSFKDCNVFLESKAGLFAESVMSVGHNTIFAHGMGGVRKAINQAWEASLGMRSSDRAPTAARQAQRDYLIVVTNKEISASRGPNFAAMLPQGALDYPSEKARTLLPLEHIYIMCISDFERVVANVVVTDRNLPDLLRECVAHDTDPTTSCFYFSMHLDRMELRGVSPIVKSAFDAAMERLSAALGGTAGP